MSWKKFSPPEMGARRRETIALVFQFRLAQDPVSLRKANHLAPIGLEGDERRREDVFIGAAGIVQRRADARNLLARNEPESINRTLHPVFIFEWRDP